MFVRHFLSTSISQMEYLHQLEALCQEEQLQFKTIQKVCAAQWPLPLTNDVCHVLLKKFLDSNFECRLFYRSVETRHRVFVIFIVDDSCLYYR